MLQQNRRRDVLEDEDVRRYCLQISRGDGLPVPGIILEFSTSIANGYNLFGQPEGLSQAYFPSGFLKSQVALRNGKVVDQQSWNDGEYKAAAASGPGRLSDH